MKTMNLKYVALGFAFVGGAAFANHDHVIGPSATISFDENSATLTESSREELAKLAKDARAKGKIDEVQVAAWSDNPAPRAGEKLSEADRKLADQRAKAVKDCLKKDLKGSDVDAYNMAERASWLSRMFDTDEAELKAEVGQGSDGAMTKEEFRVFKAEGKPSKAVVLVLLKNKG